MQTKQRKASALTIVLIVIALVLALTLIVMTVLSLPAITTDEEITLNSTQPPTAEPTVAPTEPPTEPEPTLPPPEENPFDYLDFQYEGRYLKLRDGNSITGIDVSHWQKDIDWEKVKASGVEFAMIRLGYRGYEMGAINLDSYAIANIEGAIAAGLDVGVYFFSQAVTLAEAEEEAYFVVEQLRPYKEHITMPVVFDWEHVSDTDARTNEMRDPDILTDCTLEFLQIIEASGYRPMVYFNTHLAREGFLLEELTGYDFWLAMYEAPMTFPYRVQMWQYTQSGTVPGIEGPVDIDLYLP
jgi:GH25 family lysozyme M1 (1,4-beta-N-acetylmuramidase)